MEKDSLFQSKNLIIEIYKKFISPVIPLVEKAYRLSLPKEMIMEVD